MDAARKGRHYDESRRDRRPGRRAAPAPGLRGIPAADTPDPGLKRRDPRSGARRFPPPSDRQFIRSYLPRSVMRIAVTTGFRLSPVGGFLKDTRLPSGVVKSSLVRAWANFSRSVAVPDFFTASTTV